MLEMTVFGFVNFSSLASFRVYSFLGCPHGCQHEAPDRTPQIDFLRSQARAALSAVQQHRPAKFNYCVFVFVRDRTPSKLVDFCHSFTGFCRQEPIRGE